MNQNEKIRIGFLIFEGFPMSCLTSMIEPLRAANEISGTTIFEWKLFSETGERVTSSANVAFDPNAALSADADVDFLFLLSGPATQFDRNSGAEGAMRSLGRHGAILGGISGGVFPLARSGVLAGYSVSVHWCYEAAFRAEFPQLDSADDVIVMDRRRYTVSGAAAAFELALRLIEDSLGGDVATEVACWFQHPLMRREGVRQRVPTARQASTDDMLPRAVAQAIEIFSQCIEEPVTVAEVADQIGVSARQIERSFKKATGQSPTHYYRAMRMKAARQLVLYSKDTMAQIALSVGYGSATLLARHYKAAFNLTPQQERQRVNMFRVEKNAPVPSV